MRNFPISLAGLLVMTAAAFGQQPPQQNPPANAQLNPQANRLDALLLQWEQSMMKVQTLSAQCIRTDVDKAWQNTNVYEGTAEFMRPNFAHLRLVKKGKADSFEEYLCTGTFLYEFVPGSKLIRIHELPPPKQGQVADDSFLGFLFGMKAAEAKRRYELALAKEDEWYVYIDIKARFDNDKADFQKARLVLMKATFLPRELWFEQPNGNEVKWDLPKLVSGAGVDRNSFTPPNPPQMWNGQNLTGWRLERAPQVNRNQPDNPPMPPRVIRPNEGR